MQALRTAQDQVQGRRRGRQHDHVVCARRERATQEAKMVEPFIVVGGGRREVPWQCWITWSAHLNPNARACAAPY
jgi:hypothetical protein